MMGTRVNPPPIVDDWPKRAACRDKPTAWFFPERGSTSIEQARAICAECPVKSECLDFALRYPTETLVGVWAGLSESERRQLRRKRAVRRGTMERA